MSFNRNTYQTVNTAEYTRVRNQAARAAQLQRELEAQRRQTEAANARASAAQNRANTLEQSISQINSRVSALQLTNTELRNAVNQSNNRLREAQEAHERSLNTMRTQMRSEIDASQRANTERMQALETAVNRDIRRSEDQLRSDLHAAIEQNNEQLHAAMDANNSRINNRITAVQNDLNTRITAVQTSVDTMATMMDTIAQSNEELLNQANEMLQVSRAVIDGARSFCEAHHHNWREADFQQLATDAANVEQDIKTGVTAAATARSGARDLFAAALSLREQVAADEMAWQAAHVAADEILTEAETVLEANRTLPNGASRIDVDYWSNGDLSRRAEQLQAMRARLENPAVTMEQMASIRELAEQYIREIQETTQYAVAANQRSVDRRDLLNRAEQHLRDRFFTTVWSDYYAGDERLGYRILMENEADGALICLTADVAPRDGELVNRFTSDIQRLPANMHSAREADQFNAAILAAINCDDLIFTKPDCTNTTAPVDDETEQDHQAWVQVPEETHREQLADRATPHYAPAKPAASASSN